MPPSAPPSTTPITPTPNSGGYSPVTPGGYLPVTPPSVKPITPPTPNVIHGNGADNFLKGTAGDDIIYGYDGSDSVEAGAGNDTIYGGNGLDTLHGGAGNDIIYGGDGHDYLYGGAGADILTSGKGPDFLFLQLEAGKRAKDAVTDFTKGSDEIYTLTITGTEKTLDALKEAASIRWTNNSNENTGTDPNTNTNTNDAKINDTVIYYTHGTASTSDDEIVMVLEDYTAELTLADFAIYRGANQAPNFANDKATVSVAENQTATGYTAKATDPNSDAIRYSLSGTDANLFTIDARRGGVEFKTAPDFEAGKTSFQFTVTATDGGGLTDTQAVTLTLTNANEAPVFANNKASVSVAENQTATSYTAQAADPDSSDTLSYSISGTDAGLFTISNAGAVSFKTAPDFEAGKTSFQFTVTATDGGGLTDTQAVTLTLTNVNEAPAFANNKATVSVAENQTATGYTANATDPDSSDTLSYSISGTDAGLFTISNAGAVSFKTAPDFEAGKTSFQFTVTATDGGGLTDTQAVTLTLTNVNEAPAFANDKATVSVAENQTATGYTANATDPDSSDTLSYSISGTDAGLFTISNAGAVSFKTAPDFEAGKTSFQFTVTATDGGGLTDTQAVTLTLTNANEAPRFPDAVATVAHNVAENQTATGYTALATDDDSNDTLTYSISGTDANLFTIDATRGVVDFKTARDYETDKKNYSITITATDTAGLTDTQTVVFALTNVNEAPVFAKTSDTATAIAENSGAGQVIYTATATDPDSADTLTYSLKTTGDHSAFTINASTGAVTLTGNPDYETKSSYRFTIIATDAGGLTDELTVSLAITDVDETPPAPPEPVEPTPAPPEDNAIHGTEGDDVIYGTSGEDTIYAYGGDDIVYGLAADDTIDGGAGGDCLHGGNGYDTIYGRAGNDYIDGDGGADTLYGGAGNDRLDGGRGSDTLYGDAGDDYLYGDGGNDTVYGGAGGDWMFGGSGNDTLYGGAGNDYLSGVYGDDTLYGGAGNDYLKGSYGDDVLYGGAGNDSLAGDYGDDTLDGGAGNDSLGGHGGNDTLNGGAGEDWLYGGKGNDTLYGDAGVDSLYGGRGGDIIDGGAGQDFISGGKGNDVFVLELNADKRAKDIVKDFATGDVIRVQTVSGTETSLGALKEAAQLRWTNTTNEPHGNPQVWSWSNNPDIMDTVIYFTHGTASTDDDEIVMVLEDFTRELTLADFDIYDGAPAPTPEPTPTPTPEPVVPPVEEVEIVNQAPRFTFTTMTLSVDENTTGTAYTALASDPDSNDTLTYSLSGTDASLLSISNAGAISFNTAPDYESSKKTYSFTVTVTDNGGLTDTQDVLLAITDMNEAPRFPDAMAAVAHNVAENQTATGYTAQASDPDGNHTLTYSLSGDDASLFTISNAGAISFKTARDYETDKKDYSVTVTATDEGGLSDTQTVVFALTDVQEIINVNTGKATFSVTGNADGALVAVRTTNDPDGNGTFAYQWQKSSTGNSDWADISGATSASYTPQSNDGYVRLHQITYTDGAGNTETVTLADNVFKVYVGTWGSDSVIYGGSGRDNMNGGAGNDSLSGQEGDDIIYGGAGNDSLSGQEGDDIIYGGTGNDTLCGYDGDDILYGGAGDDYLYGTAGDDILYGGAGADYFSGEDGDDIFVLELTAPAKDAVRNFNQKWDFGTGTDIFDSTASDKIRVDTSAGNETTLAALKTATGIAWTNNTHENTNGSYGASTTTTVNDANIYDTVIFLDTDSDGIRDSNETIVMVLEDYTTALTIADFDIV